jgi:hypothetical protein
MQMSEISISLPFGLGSCKWKPDEVEKTAAWSLYIELVTRVATQELAEYQGLDEEVLISLYSLFPSILLCPANFLRSMPGAATASCTTAPCAR